MKKRNLTMGLVGIITLVIIAIYLQFYSNILTSPYMIVMLSIFSIVFLVVLIYFFNVVKITIRHNLKRCKHDYNLVNQYELKSEYELVVESGKVPNTHLSFKRILITDYKCSKCGKLKRLKVKIK